MSRGLILHLVMVFSAVFSAICLHALLTGRVYVKSNRLMRYVRFDRRDQPWRYWMGVTSYAVVAVGMFAIHFVVTPPKHFDYWKFHPTPSAAFPKSEACFGKKNCYIAYVAPWCPTCQQELPCLKSVAGQVPAGSESGISVFVGASQREALEKFAAKIGAHAFIDPDRELAKKLHISAYPTWLRIDDRGNVKHFVGTPTPCTYSSLAYLLK